MAAIDCDVFRSAGIARVSAAVEAAEAAAEAATAAMSELEAPAFARAAAAAALAVDRAEEVATREASRLAAIQRLDEAAGALADIRSRAEVGRCVLFGMRRVEGASFDVDFFDPIHGYTNW